MHSISLQVFRHVRPDGLEPIAPARWDGFCRGRLPLDDVRPGRVDLLILTLRDERCELVEPLSVIVDDNGFLFRPDLRLRPLPQPAAATTAPVHDARALFLNRYLMHAHRWQPEAALVAQALRLGRTHPVGGAIETMRDGSD